MQRFRLWEYQKTISHGRKLLGAYFKAYFGWTNHIFGYSNLKKHNNLSRIIVFFVKDGWKLCQKMRLDALIIFLIE